MTSVVPLPAGVQQAAVAIFGAQLDRAQRYASLLATDGVAHGLIGPRETDRLWERHLLNCAVVTDLVPVDQRVVDVGSGAGLPGLAMACRRPDLRVDLVEPLQRRVTFLERAVTDVGLSGSVRVVRGRADAPGVKKAVADAAWVTARAVAPLGRLAEWCLPLLRRDGHLLAFKGSRAAEEVREHQVELRRWGGIVEDVVECGRGLLDEPARIVMVRKV